MGKKPTTPFGYIAFGKDGSATPHIDKLSDNKNEQEFAVAETFLNHARAVCGETASVKLLDENNHDFLVVVDGNPIATVQSTEIVYRDFLAVRDVKATEHILIDGQLCPVDDEKRDNIIREKIKKKLDRFYSKPKDTKLWLLIWSVTGYSGFSENWQEKELIVPECVSRARAFVKENGSGPFDRILVFSMLTKPTVIWPAD